MNKKYLQAPTLKGLPWLYQGSGPLAVQQLYNRLCLNTNILHDAIFNQEACHLTIFIFLLSYTVHCNARILINPSLSSVPNQFAACITQQLF